MDGQPWFPAHAKLALAEWLVEQESFALLDNDVPWWLLTHYPGQRPVPANGALILAYILGGGFLGAVLGLGPALAARLLRAPGLTWQRFTLALAPWPRPASSLGLSMLTVSHLKAEHVWLGWLPACRVALLAAGCPRRRRIRPAPGAAGRRQPGGEAAAFAAMLLPVGAMAAIWRLVFFVW